MNSEPAQKAANHNPEKFLNTSSVIIQRLWHFTDQKVQIQKIQRNSKNERMLTVIKAYFIGGPLGFDLKRPAAVVLLISGLTCAAFKSSDRD